MEEVKVTRNYQITIPYNIRTELGIKIGDKLIVQADKGKIIIYKKSGDITSLGLSLGKKITDKQIDRTINEVAKKIGSGNRY